MPRSSRTRAIVVPICPAPKITTSSTRSSLRPHMRAHARAESGEAITTTRSPGRICSSPRGTIIASPRMIAATFESAGISALRRCAADQGVVRRVGGDVELDDLDLAVGEDVGLARGREPERRRDRVGGLELGRDHEVDLEVALAPGVEVGGARAAHDRLRARQPLGEHRADEVGLLARAAADEQVGLLDARLADHLLGRAVALDRADVVAAARARRAGRRRCRSP